MKFRHVMMMLLAGALLCGQSGCAVRVQHAHKPPKTMPPGHIKKMKKKEKRAHPMPPPPPPAHPHAPGHRK